MPAAQAFDVCYPGKPGCLIPVYAGVRTPSLTFKQAKLIKLSNLQTCEAHQTFKRAKHIKPSNVRSTSNLQTCEAHQIFKPLT
jgi:hypothetical protein